MSAQVKISSSKVEPRENVPSSLDTYRENEAFGGVSSHCLPLDFRLLAVDGLWLFL
jgi:hypothetical protein